MRTWTERLNAPAEAVVKPAPVSIAGMQAGEIMFVPTPRTIDAFMRSIPHGTHVSVKQMRRQLAELNGAEVTCPIYTGYHLRTVSEAACEALERGVPLAEVTPFWRVLDAGTPTTGRLNCGAKFVAEQRRREGLQD